FRLSCRGGTSDLHPVPTRRSSDLRLKDRTVATSEVAGVEVGVDPGSKSAGLSIFVTWQNSSGETLRKGIVSVEILHRGQLISKRDRKSTRLNSSHVKISYAVFCLK